MLGFQPKGSIEDDFINVNNPLISKILMCNNNVQIGVNGRTIFYTTGYQLDLQPKFGRACIQNSVSCVMQSNLKAG